MQSALFIGRFQPFHKGHLEMIKRILKENERIIIVIGSAEKNFISNNPLTAAERFQLIEEALKESEISAEKYRIIPIRNVNNYALWVDHINIYVPPYTRLYTGSKIVKACYEAKSKLEIIRLKRILGISATKIRNALIKNKGWKTMVPKSTIKLLEKWEIPLRMKTIKNTMDITKYNNSY